MHLILAKDQVINGLEIFRNNTHVSWHVPETIDRSKVDQANDHTIDQFFNIYD